MLSIVVPVYNVDKVLRHCLNSLRFQSYRNIEIILVNGESTDMSAAICERFDLFGDYLMAVQCILKSEKIMYDPNLHYHYLAYKHASFFNDLTKEKLSGPKALLKIIDLTEEMSRFNVSVIKDLYINYSIQLLMHLLNEQEKNTRHLKEAKQNLYHFSLNELTNYKIIFSCMMARKMTFIYFYFWKLKHAKLN
ncbi:MAG: glycosyltransferase family A protein [Carnobacterium inhibens]